MTDERELAELTRLVGELHRSCADDICRGSMRLLAGGDIGHGSRPGGDIRQGAR